MAGKGGKDIFSLFASGRKEVLLRIRTGNNFKARNNSQCWNNVLNLTLGLFHVVVRLSPRDLNHFRYSFKSANPDLAFFLKKCPGSRSRLLPTH
jgi:hypothetical protein